MTNETETIDMAETRKEAYEMGFDRFKGLSGEETEEFTFEPFTQSAEWANTILPRLRAMAGYSDSGYGTYTEENTVLVTSEDPSAERESRYLFDELVDMYRNGAYDAVDPDREKYDLLE